MNTYILIVLYKHFTNCQVSELRFVNTYCFYIEATI